MSARARRDRVKLICTLGPASMRPDVLAELDELGADLYRINLSHTPIDELLAQIRAIRQATATELCLDTEGPQLRTGRFAGGSVDLVTDGSVALVPETVLGDETRIPIRPATVLASLLPGRLLSVDFNAVLLLVTGSSDRIQARVVSGGRVGSNKGISLDEDVALRPLSEKDEAAIAIGLREGVTTFALSFAGSPDDVRDLRAAAGRDVTAIAKIESRRGLARADEIIAASDAVILDRGDLSREIPVEHLPFVQRDLLARASTHGVPLYVATNLLESMITSPHPTRAEVNDIASTLLDGANGLVLAAETAVGAHPVRCARMVRRIIEEHEARTWTGSVAHQWLGNGMLEVTAAPHAGPLVDRVVAGPTLIPDDLPRLRIGLSAVRDLQQIALGTYSPLTGFMDREAVATVLGELRLPDGVPWPMPVVLPVRGAPGFAAGTTVVLECVCCGVPVGLLDVRDVWTFELASVAARWFGTDDARHPGVARLRDAGDTILGGDVRLLRLHRFAPVEHSLSPAQTRAIFAHRGWDKVVGFHTRNAPHRGHEQIVRLAIERARASGALVHPALGQKKTGDLTAAAILAGHEAMIAQFPPGTILLSGFFTDSWYAGPREAVFTALCRKNFGCTHFIVGRDHTGVGTFYEPEAARRLFERMGDIGIEPLFFGAVGYDERGDRYVEGATGEGILPLSGSIVREHLLARRRPPEWLMRHEVSDAVLRSGAGIFEEDAGTRGRRSAIG